MGISTVWIAVVSILALFDITKAVGEDGKPMEPSYEDAGGIVLYGNFYVCREMVLIQFQVTRAVQMQDNAAI